MQPCGAPAIAKTSPTGLHFFAHKPRHGDCGVEHPGESALHLAAKAQILKGCADAGWSAAPEVRAADGTWTADVLADNGRWEVAFEVQVSRQTHSDYEARQRRNSEAGVRAAWYVTRPSSVLEPSAQLPTFLLKHEKGSGGRSGGGTEEVADGEHEGDDRGTGHLSVRLDGVDGIERMTLREAARTRLTGQLAFRDQVGDGRPGEREVQVAPTNFDILPALRLPPIGRLLAAHLPGGYERP